jgi:chitinase
MGDTTWYLSPTEASSLIKAYYCKPNFSHIMIWEAVSAENNDVGCGESYYQAVKDIFVEDFQDGSLSCGTPPRHPPTPPCTPPYQVVSGDYCYRSGLSSAKQRHNCIPGTRLSIATVNPKKARLILCVA